MNKNLILLFLIFAHFLSFSQGSTSMEVLSFEPKDEKADSIQLRNYVKRFNVFEGIDLDSSEYYFNKASKFARDISKSELLGEILLDFGYDLESKFKFKIAIRNFEKAAFIYSSLKDVEELAFIYNYIGFCNIHIYAEDKAIENYLKSLKLFEDLNDVEGVGMNFIDIGNLYYEQENYDYAKKYFQDALTIYEKLEDESGIATCYTNLGNAFADAGEHYDGIDYFKQSIAIQESTNELDGVSINYNNLGDCYIQLKDYKKAHEYFLKSLNLVRRIDEKDLLPIIYLNIADVLIKERKYKEAIYNAEKSLDLSRNEGHLDYELDNLWFLAISNEALGNDKEAINYFKQHKIIKDSLVNSDKQKKAQLFNALNELEKTSFTISDLSSKNEITQLKYEAERKVSYFLIGAIVIFAILIILLINQHSDKKKAYNLLEFKNFQINKMNEEIQVQRDGLKKMNKTKDKFFSIIAHDLKNPFNSIKGFTELLIDNSEEYDDEKRLKFLKVIKNSTNRASALLNNLLVWANSQSGNLTFNPRKTKLVKDVLDVVSLLEIQAVKKEIEIYNNVDHNLLVNADTNMLNTILRNLISNAIKFTKAGGEIRIMSELKGDTVEVIVKDNGVGLSQESLDSLFSIEEKNSNIGTANEQGSGLGLILCKDFIEKHGGRIWVKSIEGEGSQFIFTLPVWQEEKNELLEV